MAKAFWSVLAGAIVAVYPTPEVVVNNTFTKVLRQRRNEAEEGEQHAGYFGKTIAYREYAYLEGVFGIALEVDLLDDAERINPLVDQHQLFGQARRVHPDSGVANDQQVLDRWLHPHYGRDRWHGNGQSADPTGRYRTRFKF